MEKFKDFIYRQNDLVIVLLILAAAAFVIYDRVEVIMDYPQKFATEVVMEQTAPDQQTEQTAPTGSDDANANGEAAGSDDANANGEPAENAQ